MILYHNPRCSKSRSALQLLQEAGKTVEVIEYLKTPPGASEIKILLKKLGLKAQDIVRKGEDLFKEKYKNKKISDNEWMEILSKNPILIERPIAVSGEKAVIGRPPERVLELK